MGFLKLELELLVGINDVIVLVGLVFKVVNDIAGLHLRLPQNQSCLILQHSHLALTVVQAGFPHKIIDDLSFLIVIIR